MADKNRLGTARTAATLSSLFGAGAAAHASGAANVTKLSNRAIARDEAAISLYRRDGYFDRNISLNHAKRMLSDLNMHVANDKTLIAAMKDGAGLRLKNGEVLKIASRSATFEGE